MTDWLCMSEAELGLWHTVGNVANVAAKTPCIDCPGWFAAEATARGCCNGTPRVAVRRHPRGPVSAYATPQEKLAARRLTWREAKRRSVARDPAYYREWRARRKAA